MNTEHFLLQIKHYCRTDYCRTERIVQKTSVKNTLVQNVSIQNPFHCRKHITVERIALERIIQYTSYRRKNIIVERINTEPFLLQSTPHCRTDSLLQKVSIENPSYCRKHHCRTDSLLQNVSIENTLYCRTPLLEPVDWKCVSRLLRALHPLAAAAAAVLCDSLYEVVCSIILSRRRGRNTGQLRWPPSGCRNTINYPPGTRVHYVCDAACVWAY